MGIGIGTIVIADGAVLAWALDGSAGPSAQAIGYGLVALGGVVVLLSLIFWSTWAGRGYFARMETLSSFGSLPAVAGSRLPQAVRDNERDLGLRGPPLPAK
jgi:hypothetical protein